MPLSLSTTTIGVPRPPAWPIASNATPPVIAPSPITATTLPSAVGAELAHALLDPDRVADRGRGVAGAHDVVRGLGDRAERRQPAVLADRAQLVAAAGEDLVRVGLVADVPEDLVARGVEQRVQRHRQLAGAEVGAEVPADLADRVDDVLAHLLGELRELLLGELRAGPRVRRCARAGS